MTALLLLLILLPARLAFADGLSAAGGVTAPIVLPADVITQADLDHLLARTRGQLDGPVHDYNAALHDLDVCGTEYRAAYVAFSKAQTELKTRRIAGESEDHTIEELAAAEVTYYHRAQADLSKMETAAPAAAALWSPLSQNPRLAWAYHPTAYTLAREPLSALPAATRRRLKIDPDLRYLATNTTLPATAEARADPLIQNAIIDDLKAEITDAQTRLDASRARIQKQVDDAMAPIPQQLEQAKTAVAKAEVDRDQAVGDLEQRIKAKDAAIADLSAEIFRLQQKLAASDLDTPSARDHPARFITPFIRSSSVRTSVFLAPGEQTPLTLAATEPSPADPDQAARLSQIKDLKAQLSSLNEAIQKSDVSYSDRIAEARASLPQELAAAQDRLREATNDRIVQVPALQAKIPDKDTLMIGLERQIADLQKRLLDRLTQTSSLHVALSANDTVEGDKLHFTGVIINTGSQILTKVALRCQETGFHVISTANPQIIPPFDPPAGDSKVAADAPRDAPCAFRSVLADTCFYLRPGENRAITVDVDILSLTDVENLPPHCRVASGTPDSANLIGVVLP